MLGADAGARRGDGVRRRRATPRPGCRRRRRSTASWWARRPTARPTARSATGPPSRSSRRARRSRYRRGRRSRRGRALGVDVVQRPTTPLVGRGEELDLVLDALRRCRSERAVQLVTLVGVPGIGKSRLVWELFEAVDARPGLHHLAPGPLAALRRRGHLLGARRDGEGAGRHPRLRHGRGGRRRSCGDRRRPDRRSEPRRPGSRSTSARWPASRPRPPRAATAGSEAVAAWRRFFEALADQQPLVLVFEDLHWADDALLDFVDHLVDWASGVPMLVVCTARPGAARSPPRLGRRQAKRAHRSPSRRSPTPTSRG